MAKHKFASISLTVRDRAISSKFLTHMVTEQCTLGNFQKIFLFPHMAAILNFRIFVKNRKKKNKFASISLTVRGRAISSKFSTHRVSKQLYSWQFSKNFPLLKSGGHFEFLYFCQKWGKNKFASISLTVRGRAISSKFSTHRVSKQCTLGNFQKNFPLPKNGGHFEFSNFCQKLQNTNLLLPP